MQNHLGLCYIMFLIDFHRQTQRDNSVSRSIVDLALRRLLPKIIKIQKIQQRMKNEVKCKESRYRQVNQCLIMLNRLPEERD